MKVLLTNDDGIDAPGLGALARAVDGRFEKIVAAPHREHSGCSHSTTTDRPIAMLEKDTHRYSVEGTPADCVRVILHEFEGDIDFVLAGINSGGNLGVDVYHSGTVAAVREAALHGVPGIALSHYRNRQLSAEDWMRAARWVEPLILRIINEGSRPDAVWNINLPCLAPDADEPEVVECPLDFSPLPLAFEREESGLRYAGVYSKRSRVEGSDVDACFSGKITLTKIPVGL